MRTTPATLQHLTTRVGQEDHAAFRRLYALLAPATLASIRAHLPDPVQSMHVLRATFCEVWWMCAFDARCHTPQRDVARWVDAVATRRRDERVRALDLIAAGPPHAGPTSGLTGSIADLDRWTQLQFTAMLEHYDTVTLPNNTTRQRPAA
ncbi:MAG TPA: hypothetical protein VFW21_10490 [Mycobacterium sp.]|nr:hypothetical protein [Mycobacterium sp.]